MKARNVLFFFIPLFVGVVAIALLYYTERPVMSNRRPDYTLTATNLSEAFAIDEARANERYGGKVLEVNGRLREVISDGDALVLEISGEAGTTGVSCYLAKGNERRASGLATGQMITVRGVCNGALLNVVLDRCVVIERRKDRS